MLLSKLASACDRQGPDVEITGITSDSRKVQKGFLFAAIAGNAGDGATYIGDALAKGAVAILAAPRTKIPPNTPLALHPEPRKALAQMAAKLYPLMPNTIAAVTGTSGKTSTVQFLRQIWQANGHPAAAIGTLGIIGNGIERYGSLTTPDSVALHQDMQMLVNKKITHVAIEASSHGLDQFRLDGLRIKVAAFTNLSRDHLDYHKDMDAYFAVKQRLFTHVMSPDGIAVLNVDAPEYEKLRKLVDARALKCITYGKGKSDFQLVSAKEDASGQNLSIQVLGKTYPVHIKLAGAFQGMNALCAAAMAYAGGETVVKIMAALPKLTGVRGRMELVGMHNGARVYVDYAHKPDALENVLKTLRPSTTGKLSVVFGCGGGRDKGKRPIMGELAVKLADSVIVTDDNPRMEEPATIRAEIMATAKGATEIGGREQAIKQAISLLNPGDTLVIAGKGHEQGQIVGTETLPFDDVQTAKRFMGAA